MATIARENIGLLNDKIIVKVNKEDYFPTFEKKLKEYSKTVNMPGFRKGMVPAGMIKKMYGPSIYTDEVLKTVEKQLYTYLETEKPDIFAQPLALDADIRKLDLNNPAEYEFGFEIGLKPVFEIASFEKANVTLYKVTVSDEMVTEEVERMRIKGGKISEKESVGTSEDSLTILFTEPGSDGGILEGGVQKEIAVNLNNFTPTVQSQLAGKQKDDNLVVSLKEAFEGEQLESVLSSLGLEKEEQAAEKLVSLKIVKIELSEKRALDETFFKEVFPGAAPATEEDFRKQLKDEIQQYWDGQSRNQLHDQLYHYLLEETSIDFPAEFLKRWMQTGSEERKTAEQAEEEFPVFSSQLKWTLISDKLVKDNNLQVTQDELKDSMRIEVMRYFGNMSLGEDTSWLDSYIDRMLKDEKQVDATFRRLITDKIFGFAQEKVNPAEKEVTSDELSGMQHNHQH